jgi:PAS domain S-box-containing protein
MKSNEKEQWLASILRCIDIPVIITDTRRLVTFINPAAEILTTWKREDALGKDLTKVFNITDEQTRKQTNNHVKTVLNEGKVASFKNHALFINGDNTEILIDGSAAPIIDDRNNITGVVLTFRDITKHRQEVSRIVHETNNSVSGIKNSLLLIKDAIPKNHKYYQYLGKIEQEVKRIKSNTMQTLNL